MAGRSMSIIQPNKTIVGIKIYTYEPTGKRKEKKQNTTLNHTKRRHIATPASSNSLYKKFSTTLN